MGTWSADAFGNDTAADWVLALTRGGDVPMLDEALGPAAAGGPVGDPYDGEVGLAAAEVVAALRGRASPGFPDELRPWVAAHAGAATPDRVALARSAVAAIRADSELRRMWEEQDVGPWLERTADLARRLTSPNVGA